MGYCSGGIADQWDSAFVRKLRTGKVAQQYIGEIVSQWESVTDITCTLLLLPSAVVANQ